VLIEGPSGGGKSTFAALLAGLRSPQSGLLLLEGLDRQTLGAEGWCQRVAAAPQYHDNHIFSDTMLFNLLMGRRWPPAPQDVRDATDVCRALGLDDLLRRMPAGMNQMLGETGWRLSHGERSRVYIARALLQDAKVIVLDESFAALDPRTTEQCLRTVFERSPALVVIAHP
jgi:ABC-type multidrug transport system fused ATPase/permease subunit